MSSAPFHVPQLHGSAPDGSIRTLRAQMALVRSLVDELERRTAPQAPRLDGQLVEELAMLGCRVIEAAAQMAHTLGDAPDESGIHRRMIVAGGTPALHKVAPPCPPVALGGGNT